MSAPDQVTRVAIVGGGVIGTGWALHYLRMGYEVVLYDPLPAVREAAPRRVASGWPIMEQLGLASGAALSRLTIAPTLAAAVADADVVQEAAPEVLGIKRALFAELDAAAAPHTVLLTSTSGLRVTDIQADCARPGRTAAGHPFNPPYLVPLVEVCGGERTDPATLDWAMAFYERCGKYAIRLEREVPAFIASRLQEAMWREALYMIAAGEATVAQIDASIREGPAMRWAITGPIMNFHLAGGDEGIAHVLAHFGPTLKEPWTRLEAPELTPELEQRLIQGCDDEAGGRSVAELVEERDRRLVALMRARSAVFEDGGNDR
jgi:carnitine 3-dehydrogenase